MNTVNTGVKAIVLIAYNSETKIFKEILPEEEDLSWWRRIFKKEPPEVQIATKHQKLGLRTYCNLREVPMPLGKISVAIIIDEKEQTLPLVVLNVAAPKRVTGPFLIRCAFDFGRTVESMNCCIEKDFRGEIKNVSHSWLVNNTYRLIEIYKLYQSYRVQRARMWLRVKTVPVAS